MLIDFFTYISRRLSYNYSTTTFASIFSAIIQLRSYYYQRINFLFEMSAQIIHLSFSHLLIVINFNLCLYEVNQFVTNFNRLLDTFNLLLLILYLSLDFINLFDQHTIHQFLFKIYLSDILVSLFISFNLRFKLCFDIFFVKFSLIRHYLNNFIVNHLNLC